MPSTIEKGNAFRDHVARVLAAAGWELKGTEVRVGHIKVDTMAFGVLGSFGDTTTVHVETKDYTGNLSKDECHRFIADYEPLVRGPASGEAWLVSKGPITPDAREMVNAHTGMRAMDFVGLQRRLFDMDRLIEGAVAEHRREGVTSYFIPPHIQDGSDLEGHVEAWLDQERAPPLAIIGPYGTGKTTFALHLAAVLAERAKADPTRRVPIRVPLAEVYDEQSMDGLFGKLFASQGRIRGYHYALFRELNAAGRFVLIFDGFDEMKHGMTIQTFERNITRLLELDEGAAKIVVLGRDTAMHDEHEFQAIIGGVQRTYNGNLAQAEGRRRFEPLQLRDFTVGEAHEFVRRVFPTLAARVAVAEGAPAQEWVESRIAELTSGAFDGVLRRPVHARMLCQVATQPEVDLSRLTRFGLYDLFVHHLLDREARKPGRFAGFDRDRRRRFNGAVAWWMWEQGGASTTTLADIPTWALRDAASGVSHSFSDVELRRELAAGLLVEKREGDIIYFAHRSIQEFLVAEHLIRTELMQRAGMNLTDLRSVLPLMSEVVTDFMTQRLEADIAGEVRQRWLGLLGKLGGADVQPSWLELFRVAVQGTPGALDAAPTNWRPSLAYMVANGSCELRSPAAAAGRSTVLRLLSDLTGLTDTATRAAVLMLAARLCQEPSFASWLLPPLLATCLPAAALAAARADMQGKSRSHRHQVLRHEQLEFWAFLRATTIRRHDSGQWTVVVDLVRLEEDMADVAGYGFSRAKAISPLAEVRGADLLAEIARFDTVDDGGRRQEAKWFIESREAAAQVVPLVVERVALPLGASERRRSTPTIPGSNLSKRGFLK